MDLNVVPRMPLPEPERPDASTRVADVFSDLRDRERLELIAEHPERHSRATRLKLDRTEGHGAREFYRLGRDLYIVTDNAIYDFSRTEVVPGEGLVRFHLCLSGRLEIEIPGQAQPLSVQGPSLLVWYQAEGADVSERIARGIRETSVTLYCRPSFLRALAESNGITRWSLLEELERDGGSTVWHRQFPLPAGLLYVGRSLIQNPYRHGVRLLHAEAMSLQLLCEVLHTLDAETAPEEGCRSDDEIRRLDAARRILSRQFNPVPRIIDVARSVGMSESKLKRAFKARFGATVFDFGLECRMRHALELLRCKHLSVGQVAYAIGYRHQTSFTAAFTEFFGFQPRQARTQMHR